MKTPSLVVLMFCSSLLISPYGHDLIAQWRVRTVDRNVYGAQPSMVLDEFGKRHLCYITYNGDLRYATDKSGTWKVSVLDRESGGGPCSSCAIARDPLGTLHMVYSFTAYDVDPALIRYTKNEGSGWHTPVTLKSGAEGVWGLSLASDGNGHLHLSYIAVRGGVAQGALMYGSNASGSWTFDSLDRANFDASLVVDRKDRAHLCYYRGAQITYITNAPGSWQVPDSVDRVGGQMEFLVCALAVDSLLRPHLSYVSGSAENNTYAVDTSGTWARTILDAGQFSSAGSSIAVCPNGVAHLAYLQMSTGILRYATNISGSWAKQNIAQLAGAYNIADDICLGPGEYPHIAFNTPADVKVASTMPGAWLDVRPASMDFGTIQLGRSKANALWLKNIGTDPLTFTGLQMTGIDSSFFSWSGTIAPLAPGESTFVIVTFSADSVGARSAEFEIATNDPLSSLTVPLQGASWEIADSWARTYDPAVDGNARGYGIAPLTGGDVAVAGMTEEFWSTRRTDMWILRLNSYGNVRWQHSLGGASFEEVNALSTTDDGGIVAGGFTRSTGAGRNDLLVVKLDTLGNELYRTALDGEGMGSIDAVAPAPGSGVYVADFPRGHLLRLSTALGVVWDKSLWGSIGSLRSTRDGGCIVGLVSTGVPAPGGVTVSFAKFTAGGSIFWQRVLTQGNARTCAACQTTDGGFMTATAIGLQDSILLTKFDSLGTPLWGSGIRLTGYDCSSRIDMETMPDGGALIITTIPSQDGWLARVRADGSLVWERRLLGWGDRWSVRRSGGGSLYVVGTGPEAGDAWPRLLVMKLDSTGNIPGCGIVSSVSLSVPFSPSATFSSSSESPSDVADALQPLSFSVQSTVATTLVTCLHFPLADTDADGVSDAEEYGPSGLDPLYDGNGDGTADANQDNVASLHGVGGEYVTLAAPPGIELQNVEAISNPYPPGSPPGQLFYCGFFSFRLIGIPVGGTVVLTLHLPAGLMPTSYYKYGPTSGNPIDHWYQFMNDGSTGAQISGNLVTLRFVDGQRGDDDRSANGVILEPGGPGWPDTSATGIAGPRQELPDRLELSQNYPNPCNPITRFEYTIPRPGIVQIRLYDLLGRSVVTLADEHKEAGSYRLTVDASRLASGTYFLRLQATGRVEVRKIIVVR